MITLLIAEDEMMVRNILVNYIPWSTIGIDKVYEASNGADALSLAESVRPDIILSDIRMPKMSGIEFCTKYKENAPECRLIFLSAYTDKEYYRSAIHLRVVGYVEKPVQPEEVLETVGIAVKEVEVIKSSKQVTTSDVPTEQPSTDNVLVRKAMQIIQTDYSDEHLSISSIASRLYLSPNYLSIIFKREYGITINQYLTQIRLQHGEQLLKDNNLSLNDIARQIGYHDANYFSKVFKIKKGMTPSDFRKSYLI